MMINFAAAANLDVGVNTAAVVACVGTCRRWSTWACVRRRMLVLLLDSLRGLDRLYWACLANGC
jgi:hypothetical protein